MASSIFFSVRMHDRATHAPRRPNRSLHTRGDMVWGAATPAPLDQAADLGKGQGGDARTHVPDAEIMKNLKKEERLARYRHIRGAWFVGASAVHIDFQY